MNIKEIAKKIRDENMDNVGTINEQKITFIIHKFLAEMKEEIEKSKEDVIKVPFLGNFRPRMVEREKEGKKVLVKAC
ncbi:MAG: hypothetical protein Q9M36_14110 [Sulfurovum sp.]|nr:hypothetical protein [Sulfurovum sp.]